MTKSIGILLVVFGVVLLITKGNLSKIGKLSFAIGDLWMLVAAIIFAVYSILIKQKPKYLSVSSFQLSTFFLGLLFIIPFYIWETLNVPTVAFEYKTLFSIAYIGIFASLTAYIFWNKAIENIGPTKAGIIYYTLPLFSGTLALIFLGETVSVTHFYSLVLILLGIFTANYNTTKNKRGKKST